MTKDNNRTTFILLKICLRTLVNILLLFILVEGFAKAYLFSYKLFGDYPYVPAAQTVMEITIAEGSDAAAVAKILEENGIVENQYLLLARMYLGKYSSRIKTGTYSLGPGMSPETICKEICGIKSEDEL